MAVGTASMTRMLIDGCQIVSVPCGSCCLLPMQFCSCVSAFRWRTWDKSRSNKFYERRLEGMGFWQVGASWCSRQCLWCYTGVTWATCKAYLLFYQAAGSPDPFQCHYFCKYSRSWALARPRRHSLHRLLQTFQTYWHRWSRLHESDGLSCVTSSAIPCMGPFWYTIWADVYPMLPFLSQHSRALLDSDLGKAASDLNKEHLLTNGKAGIPSLWPPGFAWLWTLVRCTTEHRWMGSSTMAPGLARIFQHISGPDCGAAWGEHLKEVNLGLEVERRVLESTP